ncbi:MAG: PAS domain S-box protein [Gammaproteobacteria bacterium]|nr:PAS domain S-box protein [Gammaproteobacteria bacterium]MBU1731142.1 PAS domain S-box protein [Gammaproteobacteria bacterium]MBU1891453.1 PAS domain S-box protein [Gammaproteobacteria bacterium]
MITAAKYGSIGQKTRAWLISLLSLVFLGFACHAQAQEGAITSSLSLSQEEAEWLAAHPVIRLGIDSNYGPYSFVDENGQLQGVVRDFLTHIERTLNLRFEIVSNLNWPQLMEAVQQHRIDAVATVVHLPEREAFLEFSRIYLPTPLVIMTRKDARQMRSLDELPVLRMALVEGYSSSKQLIALYPAIRPSYVTTPLDGLRAVASGMADGYVGVLGVNTFLASQYGIANLKVNAAFDMEDNGQRFGVRKDWPQLARLLDKALAAIPTKQRTQIWQHWIPMHADEIQRLSQPTLASRLFPWLLGLISMGLLGYIVMLLWNHQLKQQLSRRKAIMEQAQTIAHLGDWSIDIASGHIQWSNELFRIAGRSPTELDWPTLRGWIHPDARITHEDYLSRLEKLLPGEQLPPLLSHLLRPDGSSRWIEINCATDFDAQGKPHRYYGTALDITERKLAEEALLESETRLRVFIEHAPAALAMFDHEMHYLAASRRWLTDYGLEDSDIIGRSHYEIFPEISEHWKTIHRRGLAGEVVQASEDRFERANGTVQWLRWEMRPWHAADGAVGGIVIFSEDITERKLAGLALLESEARYRSLLEMAPFPAVLSRLRDGILLYGNHRAEIQYGISREQGIGQPADRFYKDPEQRNHFIELLRKDGRVDDLEVLMAAMDGHIFWALVSASIVDFEGEPAIFAAINDISARKHMEDEVRQLNTELEQRVKLRTTELATANKELETFTYSVSHDLKAPLRGIDGYSRLLQEQYQGQLDEEGRLFLSNVRLGVEQMDALIEDLLAYSRMERRSLTGQSVNLARLVADILDERRTDIDARGMIVEIQGLQELTARADPEGLAMVLRNLLDNALKFTRDSHPPTLTIRGTSAEKSVILELHDNGIGFDMQFHDRIFDIFQRLLRAEDYPGTGVGLAIVRKAMQRMGGRVWAESAPGQGATFNLEIPR